MNGFDNKEFADFLSSEAASNDATAPKRIVKDLVRSRLRLSLVYIVGGVLGYLLSLAICAQCSIGLSPISWKVGSLLHRIPDPWCPLLCGAVFGISPTLVTLFILSRFQHRFLIFQMGWLPALLPIAGAFVLIMLGDSHSWQWRAIWLAAAILTPYLVEALSAAFLRQGQWKKAI